MTYGVTSSGFVDKPVEDILSEIEAAEQAAFGATFDVTAQSPAGQINGIMAAHLRELWEVAQAIYNSWDPDANTGEAQTAIAALTGTVRQAATKSTVTATVNLNAGVTLPAGSIASVSGSPDSRFVTLAAVTNGGGTAADVSVDMEAEEAGATIANAGTLTEIETPVTGWNSITNAVDATIGEEIETDEELRIRRETELRRAGAAAVDAIRADVLAVSTVVNCSVFENTSDTTDGDGVPPHAIEVVVQSDPASGDENAIAQAIWDSVSAGIERHGTTSGDATDDQGNTHTVEFTRPTPVPLYANIEVTVNDDYPSTGDADIKAALVAWAQDLEVGEDVVWSTLFPVIFSITGVVDVTTLEILDSDPPTGGISNITIDARELATLDSGDIDVTST